MLICASLVLHIALSMVELRDFFVCARVNVRVLLGMCVGVEGFGILEASQPAAVSSGLVEWKSALIDHVLWI